MNEYDVKRLALVLAIQAEIEGMKADNAYREVYGHEPTHTEAQFKAQAERLRNVVHCHNEQL